MIFRIYVSKKESFAEEARSLFGEVKEFLGIKECEGIKIFNRYDVEGISEEIFEKCRNTVFSEPPVDDTFEHLPEDSGAKVFAVEALPGQFDQRADSCAQCIQFVSGDEKPLVKTAKVYYVYGNVGDAELEKIKKYVINPVEAREASTDRLTTLKTEYKVPDDVKSLEGFLDITAETAAGFIADYRLAMDENDLLFCRDYFKTEGRVPTLTELRMIDTYWSDHCRHTTFSTEIDSVNCESEEVKAAYDKVVKIREELGRKKPLTLMELATLGARKLKADGLLPKIDESEEINACTVKIKVFNTKTNQDEDWLLLFKNETHNHPTEIEPFGGAATCIGGAIRDPLSGRAYVYQAMRVTGAADPLKSVGETIPGKLPQRKLTQTAAAGYSSYGNQIGLATGMVDEIYHPGYAAKRMEIGAVIGAVPAENVRREEPAPGDVVILLGGRTGRDGCGGATGSSKSHNVNSLSECGAEVQKGNAPEERKLQRLFKNPEAQSLIKRCNDFGAGGVSVAIGELADGLSIDLDKVPKKYDGLDGTEIAISESQERMAVVVEEKDAERFLKLADEENLEATIVATVTEEKRLKMKWRGRETVNVSREFLNSNGASKHTSVNVVKGREFEPAACEKENTFTKAMESMVSDLNYCSKRGLSERFDSTIGANTVFMPFGGKYQNTPEDVMAAKIPVEGKNTNTCSVMAYGLNPYRMEMDEYKGAYESVENSVAKLVAAGCTLDDAYLTFQEYFERMTKDASVWGKPFAALLGALSAQLDVKMAAIGGKDSMSGTFDSIHVPPTLCSFAVALCETEKLVSKVLSKAGSKLLLVKRNGEDLRTYFDKISGFVRSGAVLSASAAGFGGAAGALFKGAIGNKIGVKFNNALSLKELFAFSASDFILETEKDTVFEGAVEIGETTEEFTFTFENESVDAESLFKLYEAKLEPVFKTVTKSTASMEAPKAFIFENRAGAASVLKCEKPRVLIPVFPGTNCELDTANAYERAGFAADVFVINNLTKNGLSESVSAFAKLASKTNVIALPGGFSGGDEPEGSGKFITAFFRNPAVSEEVMKLLKQRDGLMSGICNGFQALIKLGLIEYGDIRDTNADMATLTYNRIGRHQSRIVYTRVASVHSPWFLKTNVNDVHKVPISHGEGRLICSEALAKRLFENGQIATQYCDLDGKPTMDILYNPNGSDFAIEGLFSPDGRVFGKMGHSERYSDGCYKNTIGEINNRMFESAFEYFTK